MARQIVETLETIKTQVGTRALVWAFAGERVTGIEPALSAWESVLSELLHGLSCEAGCPLVSVRTPSLPWLMAR